MKNFAAIDFETATQHHNALADAEACAWIARELL